MLIKVIYSVILLSLSSSALATETIKVGANVDSPQVKKLALGLIEEWEKAFPEYRFEFHIVPVKRMGLMMRKGEISVDLLRSKDSYPPENALESNEPILTLPVHIYKKSETKVCRNYVVDDQYPYQTLVAKENKVIDIIVAPNSVSAYKMVELDRADCIALHPFHLGWLAGQTSLSDKIQRGAMVGEAKLYAYYNKKIAKITDKLTEIYIAFARKQMPEKPQKPTGSN